MTPYVFKRSDSYADLHSHTTSTKRTIRFCGNRILLSAKLSTDLYLKPSAYCSFVLDEDKQHLYIRRANEPDDDSTTQTCKVYRASKRYNALQMTSKAVCQCVAALCDSKTSITCYVSPTPTLINNKQHFRIII